MADLYNQLETDYDYQVLDKTATGGQAQIFKVRHKKHGYVRALRLIDKAIAQHSMEDRVYKDFTKECTTLLRLGNGGHPNIIRVNKPIFIGATALIEMDHIEGADLHDILLKKGCYSYHEVLALLKGVSSALAYCHHDIYQYCINKEEDTCIGSKQEDGSYNISEACKNDLINKYKVIHNDIHTKNIRLRNDGQYILLDFGLSFSGDKVSETSNLRGGIYEYIAPEKSERGVGFGEASDIYSFGIVLYECLTGEVPFPLENPKTPSQKAIYEVEEKHKTTPPPNIWLQRQAFFKKQGKDLSKKDYPDWLDDLIMKCLEKNAKDRFKNGKELFLQVEKYLIKQNEDEIEQRVNKEKYEIQASFEDFQAENDKFIEEFKIENKNQIEALVKSHEIKIKETIESYEVKLNELKNLDSHRPNDKTNEIVELKNKIEQLKIEKTDAVNAQNTLSLKIYELEKKLKIETNKNAFPQEVEQEIKQIKSGATTKLFLVSLITLVIGFGSGMYISKKIKLKNEQENDFGLPTVNSAKVETQTAIEDFAATSVVDSVAVVAESALTLAEATKIVADAERKVVRGELPKKSLLQNVIKAYPELKNRVYLMFKNKADKLLKIGANDESEKYEEYARQVKEQF